MCDFNLSDTQQSPCGSDEAGSCCFDMTDVEEEIFHLNESLDLVCSRNPSTTKTAATVVMAVNKMKKPLLRNNWELSEDELYQMTVDSLLDQIVADTAADMCMEVRKGFLRTNSLECTLTDNHQKDIICTSGEMKLQAVTLRGGYGDLRVNFKIVKYISSGQPTHTCVLSIKNLDRYISCTMVGDEAELKLEKWTEEDLSNSNNEDSVDRFLFKQRTSGKNISTFESVRCSGWFISTSSEGEKQPVAMCKVDANNRITSFRISS